MTTTHPTFIVAVGGSAGGLYAYQEFLDALPDNTGMAFVIISHILPSTSHSLLAEILAKHARMRVQVISEAMAILPNHVYVIAPNVNLTMQKDYTFHVVSPRTMNQQIDLFLESLAAVAGKHAIGIIVSGYDGDGSHGCKTIKARGGLMFAQDSSATVGHMPLSAQESGCVDFVLPAGRIAAELQKISRRGARREESQTPVASRGQNR